MAKENDKLFLGKGLKFTRVLMRVFEKKKKE